MLSDHQVTSEQKLGDLFSSVLHQLHELKGEVQNSNLVQDGQDFFDLMYLRSIPDEDGNHRYLPSSGPAAADSFESLSLQLRVAIPDIRGQGPGPYIQEIPRDSESIELKLNNRQIHIHRPKDAKLIYIISGDGIFGPVHNIRPVALLLRNWLLNMLRNLAVLRGICILSQSSGSLFGSSKQPRALPLGRLALRAKTNHHFPGNVAMVLAEAKESFVSSVAHFLHHVGALRAINQFGRSAKEISDGLSRNHISMLLGSGLWLATTRLQKDVEYAPNTLGSLITIRSDDLQAVIPNPRERPDWHKELVDNNVKLNESINKDAAIAIAHNENADNPWRHALFKDMSPSQAVRTQGRIIHRHLEDAAAFLKKLESKLNAESLSPRKVMSLSDVYLVIGTSSLLLDSGVVRVHDHKTTCETTDKTEEDTIVRTTTTQEVDVIIETESVSSENQYCFALEVLKVEMDKGRQEAGKLAMSLTHVPARELNILDFQTSKDTPNKPTALEHSGAHAGSGTSGAACLRAHTHEHHRERHP